MDPLGFARDFEAVTSFFDDAEEQERDFYDSQSNAITPASFGAPVSRAAVERLVKPKAPKDPKAIWDEDEVLNSVEDDYDDGRPVPKYEWLHRQAVGTEDAYLGMSDKDPSSTQCEEIVLRVFLPGTEKMSEITLDVHEDHIRLESPQYKLVMYLPNKVDSDKGSAKWDKKTESLSIIMPKIKEDIFANLP
mmetsp:Transcript_14062/g.17049  ORF Transcript_14062/g.17049 Transcript_14062/m.17049 type:complete len:191 (+) Transcript_14062:105-677(+)|eukprot:CAMPEP_0197862600 /NCGR_PEP_ID=MMETSP1438-20131217/39480_1 /TAXON_ID=1461541 /ORGANISM="Pterosperma sp., Strain CCMP1384" /LENGTH=190 /DNA_ID=CAMNT_0043480207 /DNA_START=99 /DNA_END=671 /DNA_ORIENTATION=+